MLRSASVAAASASASAVLQERSSPASASTPSSSPSSPSSAAYLPPIAVRIAAILLAHLRCTACNSTLSKPVALPCGHSICAACLYDRMGPSTNTALEARFIKGPAISTTIVSSTTPTTTPFPPPTERTGSRNPTSTDDTVNNTTTHTAAIPKEVEEVRWVGMVRKRVRGRRRSEQQGGSRATGHTAPGASSSPDSADLSPSTQTTSTTDAAASAAAHADLAHFQTALLDVLECQLCYLLLYEPITTPCGHTFCRACFARNLDHSDRCPLCRARMPSWGFWQEHATSKCLMDLILLEVDRLYTERRLAAELDEASARLSTPIFVCTLAYPDMPTVLHIYEPRYRLMVRRCLESGNPRFGMVMPARTSSPNAPGMYEYGTMLEIRSVQMLPDGRSMIETVGSYRFRVHETGTLDGYSVGRVERIEDAGPEEEMEMERVFVELANGAARAAGAREPPTPAPASAGPGSGSAEAQENGNGSTMTPMLVALHPSIDELVDVCVSFIETLRSGSAPLLLTRLNQSYGPMPARDEIGRLAYWMALVIPIDEHEKARLLSIRSARLRLRLVVHWIEQLRSSWWFASGCTVC
ncbi:hypothetical protein V8E36_005450 [Tilletia maclaganii]